MKILLNESGDAVAVAEYGNNRSCVSIRRKVRFVILEGYILCFTARRWRWREFRVQVLKRSEVVHNLVEVAVNSVVVDITTTIIRTTRRGYNYVFDEGIIMSSFKRALTASCVTSKTRIHFNTL